MSYGQRSSDARHLLPNLLKQPERLSRLSLSEWDLVIRQARHAGVLARLTFQLDDLGFLDLVPERPRRHLDSARTLALKHARDVRWEVTNVRRVLDDCGVTMTLLKGAAYLMAELPPSRGRLFGDIDFMVPRERIDEVEHILVKSDWIAGVKDPYDQMYYRRWTHQIPPLQHYKRNSLLDVHHTIVPLTARAPIDAGTLAASSLSLSEDGKLRILAPTDMVLHSAVHLFNEGEFDRGLRDLLDLDDLLHHFSVQPDFWRNLVARAEALHLTDPLFLTLRYRHHLLGKPVPSSVQEGVNAWSPAMPKRALFDTWFHRALLPNHPTCNGPLTGPARWFLYVRAHYLRMPLYLLLPHLLRKALVPTSAD